jgi:hypothetical protein
VYVTTQKRRWKVALIDEVTWVTEDICTCNNCGAFAGKPEEIEHHKTCKAGEAEKWERFYEAANSEEGKLAY